MAAINACSNACRCSGVGILFQLTTFCCFSLNHNAICLIPQPISYKTLLIILFFFLSGCIFIGPGLGATPVSIAQRCLQLFLIRYLLLTILHALTTSPCLLVCFSTLFTVYHKK